MKSWLAKNEIEMFQYITKENQLLYQDILETTNKIYKYMTSISKNVYIDNLDDIVNKYNNT